MDRSSGALLFLILALPIAVGAQSSSRTVPSSEDDVVRVSTNLVSVPITVKSRAGGYMLNLKAEDFSIYENGAEQAITHFESVNKPFTVTLMLDISDSTRIEFKDIQDAAVAFLKQLQPDDRAWLMAFDKRVTRLTDITGDRDYLTQVIRALKSGGGTSLYDAVQQAMSQQRSFGGRKAVVLLTDGIDTSSLTSSFESTLRAAMEEYALIYPIQFDCPTYVGNNEFGSVIYTTPNGESMRKAYERGGRYLGSLATGSGGRFQHAENLKALERSFARIADELRQQYTLAYYPIEQNPKSEKRRIKVVVRSPDAVVHARDYYLSKPKPE